MNASEWIADLLARNLEFLKWTLSDFTDTEMLVRPAPGANHIAWQVGHLTVEEKHFNEMIKPGSMPELPAGFEDKFTKKTCGIDDPKAWPTKAELINAFVKQRTASVALAKTLTTQDLDKPSPEMLRGFAPTVGHLMHMHHGHVTMHVGQMQVIRRKLGKPILF